MAVTYRPARSEDLETGVDIVVQAINDLRRHHGFPLEMKAGPASFQAFCLAERPDGLWVAVEDDHILGFAMSWMSQQFWFLAQLFVRPEMQARGVGQALLSRTLEQAQRNGAEHRALVTFAYNTKSTGLYIRNGMYPREPLYFMSAPTLGMAQRLEAGQHEVAQINSLLDARTWITQVDAAVLGFHRDAQHSFLFGSDAGTAVQITRAGGIPEGYAYISPDGHIGPFAMLPDADAKSMVNALLRWALRQQSQQLSLIVPGRAAGIMAAVSKAGFRIAEPYVLLSAQPFGNWKCYLPSNPGYL